MKKLTSLPVQRHIRLILQIANTFSVDVHLHHHNTGNRQARILEAQLSVCSSAAFTDLSITLMIIVGRVNLPSSIVTVNEYSEC